MQNPAAGYSIPCLSQVAGFLLSVYSIQGEEMGERRGYGCCCLMVVIASSWCRLPVLKAADCAADCAMVAIATAPRDSSHPQGGAAAAIAHIDTVIM